MRMPHGEDELEILNVEGVVYNRVSMAVSLEIPILSVYKKDDKYYLLSNYDCLDYKHLFFEIDKDKLILMLEDKISLSEAYMNNSDYHLIELDGEFEVESVKHIDVIPDNLIPDPEKLGLFYTGKLDSTISKII